MRRRLKTIAMFAAIGAVLTFAGGWGCMFWRMFVSKGYLGAGEGRVEPGGWPLPPPARWPRVEHVQVTRDWGYERRVAYASGFIHVPPDVMGPAGRAAGPDNHVTQFRSLTMFRRRSGWPLRCMQSAWVESQPLGTPQLHFSLTPVAPPPPIASPPDQYGRGWTLGMYYERGIPWPRMVRHADGSLGHFNLPVKPVWWAFAGNAVLWGFAAWVPIRGVWALRRAIRARRGVCLHCAYPVGLARVCTECGRPVRCVTPAG